MGSKAPLQMERGRGEAHFLYLLFVTIHNSIIFNQPNQPLMIGHITLIIAHNHHIIQTILQNILQSCAGICVLAKVDTAEGLLQKTKELKLDVVVAELSLPGMAILPHGKNWWLILAKQK